MNLPDELARLHTDAETLFQRLHVANDDSGQQDANLREAVAQASAAVSALGKAVRCARAAAEAGVLTSA